MTYFGGVWIWKSGVQIHSFSVEVPDGAGISLSPSPPPLGFSVLVQAWATIATHSDPASSASTVQSYFYCLPEGKPMLSICSILSPCRDSAVAINILIPWAAARRLDSEGCSRSSENSYLDLVSFRINGESFQLTSNLRIEKLLYRGPLFLYILSTAVTHQGDTCRLPLGESADAQCPRPVGHDRLVRMYWCGSTTQWTHTSTSLTPNMRSIWTV